MLSVEFREVLVRELKYFALFAAASSVQTYFMCGRCSSPGDYFLVISFTFFMWVFLWRGNSALTHLISAHISWMHHPATRAIVGFIVTVVYTLAAAAALMAVYERAFNLNFGDGYYATLVFAVCITLVISLILHCREFLMFWRKASLEAARFQRESTAAKYETLKSQVNPAFLFNSLSTLSALVREDEEKAVRYVKSLADVYRYVLDTREMEVVPLRDELAFLSTYSTMLRARNAANFTIRCGDTSGKFLVSPLAIHMLIEQLIQVAGRDQTEPSFLLGCSDSRIDLFHNVDIRDKESKMRFEQILRQIRDRYRFLTSGEVSVEDTSDGQRISLPLIVSQENDIHSVQIHPDRHG